MSELIEENGVKVQFPDNNFFRFGSGNCKSYESLKQLGVKEVDVCWFDVKNDTLHLIELKAFYNTENDKYYNQDLEKEDLVNKWISDLEKKTLHAVCMVTQNRSNTQTCMNNLLPNNNTKINVSHVVKIKPEQAEYLGIMQDKLRQKLQPILNIFSISSVTVINYDSAVKNKTTHWIV